MDGRVLLLPPHFAACNAFEFYFYKGSRSEKDSSGVECQKKTFDLQRSFRPALKRRGREGLERREGKTEAGADLAAPFANCRRRHGWNVKLSTTVDAIQDAPYDF